MNHRTKLMRAAFRLFVLVAGLAGLAPACARPAQAPPAVAPATQPTCVRVTDPGEVTATAPTVSYRTYWDTRDAAKKAVIANRIGDFGFLIAAFLMFSAFGSLQFDSVFHGAAGISAAATEFEVLGKDLSQKTIATLVTTVVNPSSSGLSCAPPDSTVATSSDTAFTNFVPTSKYWNFPPTLWIR